MPKKDYFRSKGATKFKRGSKSIFDVHQKQVIRGTKRMPKAMRGVMGDYR